MMQMLFSCCGGSPDSDGASPGGVSDGKQFIASLAGKASHLLDEGTHFLNQTAGELGDAANKLNEETKKLNKGKHSFQSQLYSKQSSSSSTYMLDTAAANNYNTAISNDSTLNNVVVVATAAAAPNAYIQSNNDYNNESNINGQRGKLLLSSQTLNYNSNNNNNSFLPLTPESSSGRESLKKEQRAQLQPLFDYLKNEQKKRLQQSSNDNDLNVDLQLSQKQSFEEGLESTSISNASQLSDEFQQNLTDVLLSSNSPYPTFGLADGSQTPGAALTSLSQESLESASVWNKAEAETSAAHSTGYTDTGAALTTSYDQQYGHTSANQPLDSTTNQVQVPVAPPTTPASPQSFPASNVQQPQTQPTPDVNVDKASSSADSASLGTTKKPKKMKVPSAIKGLWSSKKKNKDKSTVKS